MVRLVFKLKPRIPYNTKWDRTISLESEEEEQNNDHDSVIPFHSIHDSYVLHS